MFGLNTQYINAYVCRYRVASSEQRKIGARARVWMHEYLIRKVGFLYARHVRPRKESVHTLRTLEHRWWALIYRNHHLLWAWQPFLCRGWRRRRCLWVEYTTNVPHRPDWKLEFPFRFHGEKEKKKKKSMPDEWLPLNASHEPPKALCEPRTAVKTRFHPLFDRINFRLSATFRGFIRLKM